MKFQDEMTEGAEEVEYEYPKQARLAPPLVDRATDGHGG